MKVRGKLKLIDFGISQMIQDEVTSMIIQQPEGTPNYIAPEVIFFLFFSTKATIFLKIIHYSLYRAIFNGETKISASKFSKIPISVSRIEKMSYILQYCHLSTFPCYPLPFYVNWMSV